jgi:hypothetical protein
MTHGSVRRAGLFGAVVGLALLLGCKDSTAPAGSLTVNGVVYDINLEPQAQATVLVSGAIPVTTDAFGRFSVSGVVAPYQVAAVLPSSQTGVVYDGLTLTNPAVVVPVSTLSSVVTHQAVVSGTVSGGAGYPEPANYKSSVIFESPETVWSWVLDPSTGGYGMAPQWYGPVSTTGSIHVLQWQYDAATGVPTAYAGYGTHTGVTLWNGDSLGGEDVALGPVTTGSLSGSVTLPAGYTVARKTLNASFATSPRAPWVLFTDVATATDFSYVTPSLTGTTLTLEVEAEAGAALGTAIKTGLSASANGIALSIPAAPLLSGLQDGATGVRAGERVSWSGMSGAIYGLGITPSLGSGASYLVFTADTTALIPDLSALSLGLLPATAYDWFVAGIAPISGLDELAGTATYMPAGDWSSARSAPRHFTTAP